MIYAPTTAEATSLKAHPGLHWQTYLPYDSENPLSHEDYARLAKFQPGEFYRAAFERWRATLQPGATIRGNQRLAVEGTITGRFLTGTGAASVFDTSYQFHPVYGVPYLPGTGLRGALRATMTKQFPLEAQALFGSSTEGREAAGYASVYDALWVPGSAQSPYAVDVLTVHHQDYYGAQDGQAVPAPTDFDQPNPVHFITAQGKMLFVLEAPNAEWLGFLRQVLEVTLHHSGTGAKKSSGYGRFALSGS